MSWHQVWEKVVFSLVKKRTQNSKPGEPQILVTRIHHPWHQGDPRISSRYSEASKWHCRILRKAFVQRFRSTEIGEERPWGRWRREGWSSPWSSMRFAIYRFNMLQWIPKVVDTSDKNSTAHSKDLKSTYKKLLGKASTHLLPIGNTNWKGGESNVGILLAETAASRITVSKNVPSSKLFLESDQGGLLEGGCPAIWYCSHQVCRFWTSSCWNSSISRIKSCKTMWNLITCRFPTLASSMNTFGTADFVVLRWARARYIARQEYQCCLSRPSSSCWKEKIHQNRCFRDVPNSLRVKSQIRLCWKWAQILSMTRVALRKPPSSKPGVQIAAIRVHSFFQQKVQGQTIKTHKIFALPLSHVTLLRAPSVQLIPERVIEANARQGTTDKGSLPALFQIWLVLSVHFTTFHLRTWLVSWGGMRQNRTELPAASLFLRGDRNGQKDIATTELP